MALRALVPTYKAVREEIKLLEDDPDVATGHAFVVFNEELARSASQRPQTTAVTAAPTLAIRVALRLVPL